MKPLNKSPQCAKFHGFPPNRLLQQLYFISAFIYPMQKMKYSLHFHNRNNKNKLTNVEVCGKENDTTQMQDHIFNGHAHMPVIFFFPIENSNHWVISYLGCGSLSSNARIVVLPKCFARVLGTRRHDKLNHQNTLPTEIFALCKHCGKMP